MSPEEARDAFSEAFEDELDPARQKAFEAALAADDELRMEYASFVETLQLVRGLGEDDHAPDLLTGVQERLRKRSRGRYYRDRFAQRAAGGGWVLALLLAMASVLVLATAWYALHARVELEATTAESTVR